MSEETPERKQERKVYVPNEGLGFGVGVRPSLTDFTEIIIFSAPWEEQRAVSTGTTPKRPLTERIIASWQSFLTNLSHKLPH